MIEAMMPDIALGITTLFMVSQWDAPSARLPSLTPLGTDLIASSDTDMTVGSAMIPSTIPAVRYDWPTTMERLDSMKGIKIIIPINPYTMEGISFKISMIGFMIDAIDGDIISDKTIADGTPRITAITVAITVT